MTHPTLTPSQSCDADPGFVDVTITIGNDGFTEPVQSIDLYGTAGLAEQPPLSPAGQWPKVVHTVLPAGTYTAGAQFHFATGPTRANEITITVDPTACTPTTEPTTAQEPPPPVTDTTPETGTATSIDVPATDAPAPVSSEPVPTVEPVVPVVPPPATSSTTTASVAVPVTLPLTGAGDRATVGLEPGFAFLLVGLALTAAARRRRPRVVRR